jgi:hypothetical protein
MSWERSIAEEASPAIISASIFGSFCNQSLSVEAFFQ